MLTNVSIEQVIEGSVSLREVYIESNEFKQLKLSIQRYGLMTPLLVRPLFYLDGETPRMHENGKRLYEVVDGLHRLIACRILKLTTINVEVTEASDQEVLYRQIVSSQHRVPIKPYEYKKHLLRIIASHNFMSLSDLCERICVEPDVIIRLLTGDRLCSGAVKLVKANQITLNNAYYLAKLPKSDQEKMSTGTASLCAKDFANFVHQRIKEIRAEKIQKRNLDKSPIILNSSHTVCSYTKVSIKESKMSREYLDGKKARKFLAEIPRSHMFTVIFEKKDGTLREMTGRRDVRKHLKGGESTIKDHKNLQSIYDTGASDYRCFDTNKVLSIKGEGYEFKVNGFVREKNRVYTATDCAETKPKFAKSGCSTD